MLPVLPEALLKEWGQTSWLRKWGWYTDSVYQPATEFWAQLSLAACSLQQALVGSCQVEQPQSFTETRVRTWEMLFELWNLGQLKPGQAGAALAVT